MIKPAQITLCLSRMVGGSRLEEADLHGADLRRAKLYGADLRRAGLRGADLRYADLWAADLSWSDLRGATKYGRQASPLVCALAKVGAPWDYIDYEWGGRGEWAKPDEQDHWVGIAKLHMLGLENSN